jgi:hypothetical protein
VKGLGLQYFHYGRWRRAVMRRHEGTVNLRYLAPPIALTGVMAGCALTVAGVRVGAVLPVGYAAVVVAGSVVEGGGLPAAARLWLPLVTATMHLAWGTGFLTSPRRLALPRTGLVDGVHGGDVGDVVTGVVTPVTRHP